MTTNKRGIHTNYEYEDTLIYEFKSNFYIIQRGQQGIILNPLHGNEQRGGESIKLFMKLPNVCTVEELGLSILGALAAFDVEGPDFDQWDNKRIAKNLKTWLGARGQKDIVTNGRLVSVTRWLTRAGGYEITPFDNHNLDPWWGPMEQADTILQATASSSEIGDAVRQAFTVATYNQNYTTERI